MSLAPIRAVAFDLDGLMFDTEALFARILSQFLVDRGRTPTPEILSAMIGKRAADAYPMLKRMCEFEDSPEALLKELRARFEVEMDAAVHPTPGLFALLAHLEKRNIPRAVTTSSRRAYAERLLRRHGVWEHFSFLLGSEDVLHGKPSPEIYKKAAAGFGIETKNLLVLEDSPPGLAAARAAGAFAVGIPHEHSPASGLGDASLIVERLDSPELFERIDLQDALA